MFVEGLGRAEVQAAFDVEDRDARRRLALRAFAQFAGLGEVILDDFGRRRLAEVEGHRHRRTQEDRHVEGREERRREGREEDRAVLRAGFQDQLHRGKVGELDLREDDEDRQRRERHDGHHRPREEERAEDEHAAEQRGQRRAGAAGDVEGGAADRTRGGHAAREGADEIGHPEAVDFLVKVGRAAGLEGRGARVGGAFDDDEHRERQGRREERRERARREVGKVERRPGLGGLSHVADEVGAAALGVRHVLGEDRAEGRDHDRAEDGLARPIFRTQEEIRHARDEREPQLRIDERAAHAGRVPQDFRQRIAGVLARHAERGGQLQGDDAQGGRRDVGGDHRARDEVGEAAEPQPRGQQQEHAGHQDQRGEGRGPQFGRDRPERGEGAEQQRRGGVGRSGRKVGRAAEERGDGGRDAAAHETAPDGQAGLHREGHGHREGEERDVQSGDGIGAEGRSVHAAQDAGEREEPRTRQGGELAGEGAEGGEETEQAAGHGPFVAGHRRTFNRFRSSIERFRVQLRDERLLEQAEAGIAGQGVALLGRQGLVV